MALENTPLMQEIQQIADQGPLPVHYSWRVEILANGKTLVPLKLLSFDLIRMYDFNYADMFTFEVVMGAGSFAHEVYPYKNDLQVTLFRDPIGELSDGSDLSQDIESQTLRATLMDTASPVVEGNSPFAQSKDAMDIANLITVRFQLVDLTLEQIRMQSIGGSFRKVSAADVLKYLLTHISQLIQVDDAHKIKGVDFYPASNNEPQEHVVIPHGTPFTDVPDLLHYKTAGIYNAGFGYYLQKGMWYVYPLYDVTRYQQSLKGLTLINVPKNRMPQTERSYRTTGNQVIALITGEVIHEDNSEAQQLNQGNGVRFTDPMEVIEGFATVENNKMTVLRAKNNSEFLTQERDNRLNKVVTAPSRILSNNFAELGHLAKRAGSRIKAVWQNSDPELIFPGMPVKLLYLVEDQVVEAYGVVTGAEHYTALATPGITSKRYHTHSALTVFLNRKIDWDPA